MIETLKGLLKRFWPELTTISKNQPLVAATFILAGVVATYFICSLLYSNQISNLQTANVALQAALTLEERKASSCEKDVSADQQPKPCKENDTLDAYRWRSLTQEQIANLENNLKAITRKVPLTIRCLTTSTLGCNQMAKSLAIAFGSVSWPAKINGYISIESMMAGSYTGILIGPENEFSTPVKESIESALKISLGYATTSTKEGEIEIIIGDKP